MRLDSRLRGNDGGRVPRGRHARLLAPRDDSVRAPRDCRVALPRLFAMTALTQCAMVLSADPFLNHSICEPVNVCLRLSIVVVPSVCVTMHVTGLPGVRSERPDSVTRSPSRILS